MKNDLIYFYKSTASLKNKLEYIAKFKKYLVDEIEKEFNALYIEFPYFHKNNSEYTFSKINRIISFDSNNVEGFLEIYNDNLFWIHNKLTELEIGPKKSIYSLKKFFKRDNEILKNQPIESEHLLIEFVVEKEKCNNKTTIEIFGKICDIFKKIIVNMQSDGLNVENYNLFSENQVIEFSKLKAKFPFHNLKDMFASYLTENPSIAILFDAFNKEIASYEFIFDPIQNNFKNTLHFLTYNKNSIAKNQLIKIAERPTMEVIKKQADFFQVKVNNEETLKSYDTNNIFSYTIDINLSAIFSSLFGEFSIAESSHSPGNTVLEKEYKKLKIKIF